MKHKAQCVYDRVLSAENNCDPSSSSTPFKYPFGHINHTSPTSSSEADTSLIAETNLGRGRSESFDPPESRDRRLLEIRLILYFKAHTERCLYVDEKSRLSLDVLTQLFLESDALLYAVLAIAALHSSLVGEQHPQGQSYMAIHEGYLAMSIREQNKAVMQMNRNNITTLIIAANYHRICAIAALQGRAREPYTPPLDWLMSGTARALFHYGSQLAPDDSDSYVWRLLKSSPVVLDEEQCFPGTGSRSKEYLLDRRVEAGTDEQPWDARIQDAYETTLSYIDAANTSAIFDSGLGDGHRDGKSEAIRRLIIFPMMVKKSFVELVQARKPRALVVLAHYFALLYVYGRNWWWIGNAGAEEIEAIASELKGTAWYGMLAQPLELVKRPEIR